VANRTVAIALGFVGLSATVTRNLLAQDHVTSAWLFLRRSPSDRATGSGLSSRRCRNPLSSAKTRSASGPDDGRAPSLVRWS